MIPVTDAFKVICQQPHTAISRVDVYFNDVFVRSLDVHAGSVDADRNAAIMRRFDCRVSDPNGDLTPQGIRDLLAPFGTVLKLYRGVEIPLIDRASSIFDTQGQWDDGDMAGVVATADGRIVLGTT